MDIPKILDAAKKAQGFETDMALAKGLGISRSAVSAWRKGVSTPDTVQCAALAGYTGIPLARVLGIVGEARAISAKEKAVWRRLAATATLLLAGVIGASPRPAEAAPHRFDDGSALHFVISPENAHYVRRRVGYYLNLLRLWLSNRRRPRPASDTLEAAVCL